MEEAGQPQVNGEVAAAAPAETDSSKETDKGTVEATTLPMTDEEAEKECKRQGE